MTEKSAQPGSIGSWLSHNISTAAAGAVPPAAPPPANPYGWDPAKQPAAVPTDLAKPIPTSSPILAAGRPLLGTTSPQPAQGTALGRSAIQGLSQGGEAFGRGVDAVADAARRVWNSPLKTPYGWNALAPGGPRVTGGDPVRLGGYEPTIGDAASLLPGVVAARVPALARAAAPAAATATGFGPLYYGGRAVGSLAAGQGGNALRNLGMGVASAAVPAVADNLVQGARNPGQPQDATSRLVAPQQGGALGSLFGGLSAANASLSRATGFDPLAALGGVPTTPESPGLKDFMGRNVSNLGDAASMAVRSPPAAFRAAGNALGDYASGAAEGDYFPGQARLTNETLGRSWAAVPGGENPSVQTYQALGSPAMGAVGLAGLGGGLQAGIDQAGDAARGQMLGSNRVNNPQGAADDLVMGEAMNRLRAERPDAAEWSRNLEKTRQLSQALPASSVRAKTLIPSGRDFEDARARFGRPDAPPSMASVDPQVQAARQAEFEKLVSGAKDRFSARFTAENPGAALQKSYSDFRPALEKAMTAGMGGAAFAGAAPVMNEFLSLGQQAGVEPHELMGAISNTAKVIGEAATDPSRLEGLASGPPPAELVKAVADPNTVGRLPGVGQANEVARAAAAGEISPEEAAKGVWGQMGSGARILLGAGLGITALSLLMHLFGGGDDKDPEGGGGMSFFWKVAPLLGLGAAAWGLASRDDVTKPQFSRLLSGDTWTGLADDVGLGGLLRR